MRRDISIITERQHLASRVSEKGQASIDEWMGRGAPRKKSPEPIYMRFGKKEPVIRDRFNKQYNSFECINGLRLALAGNRNRQRKKGPLVRFGRKS